MKTITIIFLFFFSFLATICLAQDKNLLNQRIQSMVTETDPLKNAASLDSIVKEFNLIPEKDAEEMDVMHGIVALTFLKAKQYPSFEVHISAIQNPFNETSYLNMAADILSKEVRNFNYAEKIAQQLVQKYDGYKDILAARPKSFPLADWQRFVTMAAYPYYTSYARALYLNGKSVMALRYLEKAIKGYVVDDLSQDDVELYAKLLEANNQDFEAHQILLQMLKIGKSSLGMEQQFKSLDSNITGNSSRGIKLVDSIKDNQSGIYLEAISKKMIQNLKAPHFSLKDIYGKEVSLVNFLGKVVVLDFWATWCVPCIASMPAMEQLSKSHPEVAFLFIATNEPGTAAKDRVKAYLDKNSFPLNSLLDQDASNLKKSPVSLAYKITGIPTKFVIDKKGNLKFSTSGYSTDSELIGEMEAMIKLAEK